MERRVEWANIDNPFLISPAINLPYYSHLPNTETGTCRFKYLLLHRKTSLYIVTSNEALKRVFHSAVVVFVVDYYTIAVSICVKGLRDVMTDFLDFSYRKIDKVTEK